MTEEKKPLVASNEDIIRWQLKCLANVASDLTEKELDLVASFGDQFAYKRTLSVKQMEILEEIYKRRT